MKEDSALLPCVQMEKMNFGETLGYHPQNKCMITNKTGLVCILHLAPLKLTEAL